MGPYLHSQLLFGPDGFVGRFTSSLHIHKAASYGQSSTQVCSPFAIITALVEFAVDLSMWLGRS